MALLPALAAASCCHREPAAKRQTGRRIPPIGVLVVSAASATTLLRMKPVSASAVARVRRNLDKAADCQRLARGNQGREQHQTE